MVSHSFYIRGSQPSKLRVAGSIPAAPTTNPNKNAVHRNGVSLRPSVLDRLSVAFDGQMTGKLSRATDFQSVHAPHSSAIALCHGTPPGRNTAERAPELVKRLVQAAPLAVAILMLSACSTLSQAETEYQEMAKACRASGGIPKAYYSGIGSRFFDKCVYFPTPTPTEGGVR